tara:strand:+ start:1495 stop:2091 length:597 start_codon:yes stop_codon:yes gene_type:complete
MAIKVNFKIAEACDNKSIIFTDITGAYSSANLTGWGAPNPLISTVIDVEIIVLAPDGNTYVISMADIAGDLPSDSNGIFHIHMGYLGGAAGTTIQQGVYNIEYRVIYNDGTSTGQLVSKRKYTLAASVIKCCVHKMLANLDMCDDCPCGEDKSNALEAYTLYKAMLYAYTCGSTVKAGKMATQVEKLCNYKGTCASCT